jgi:hypothetical protein
MRPSRIELASQDTRRLVAHSHPTRNYDIVVRPRQIRTVQAKAFADLTLEAVSLDAVHPGFDRNTESCPGTAPWKTKKTTHAETLHLATLEELQVFGAKTDPSGFRENHFEATVGTRRLRPLARRLLRTFCPLAVAMRERKPWVFVLFLREGW